MIAIGGSMWLWREHAGRATHVVTAGNFHSTNVTRPVKSDHMSAKESLIFSMFAVS